jgi:hypothetical protein
MIGIEDVLYGVTSVITGFPTINGGSAAASAAVIGQLPVRSARVLANETVVPFCPSSRHSCHVPADPWMGGCTNVSIWILL